MKVAYLSVYRDGTGYANAAIDHILSLDKVGVDVVIRPIRLSQSQSTVPERLLELEKRPLDDVDIVVQHMLPCMFEKKAGVKNIGSFSWETNHFRDSSWPSSCAMMDACVTSCIQAKTAVFQSHVSTPIHVVPFVVPINIKNDPLPIKEAKNKCVFYTIAEYSRRKNIAGLIRAYYGAFTKADDVLLIIKTNVPGMNPTQSMQHLVGAANEIKRLCRSRSQEKYPPIIFITDYLSDTDIAKLHSGGDVFVSLSHGESWCIPAATAMGFGNPVIASNWGSFPDLMYDQYSAYFSTNTQRFGPCGCIDTGWLINGQLNPCFGQDNAMEGLYTANQLWFDPNITEASYAMLEAYQEWMNKTLQLRSNFCKTHVKKFTHENAGNRLKEIFTEILGGTK